MCMCSVYLCVYVCVYSPMCVCVWVCVHIHVCSGSQMRRSDVLLHHSLSLIEPGWIGSQKPSVILSLSPMDSHAQVFTWLLGI